jgi:hypothetical protein
VEPRLLDIFNTSVLSRALKKIEVPGYETNSGEPLIEECWGFLLIIVLDNNDCDSIEFHVHNHGAGMMCDYEYVIIHY